MSLAERPYLIATAEDFPTGLRCATCKRHIGDGQPFVARPEGMCGGDTISVLTCVYCEGNQ